MNLNAYFVFVILGHFHIVEVIVLFWRFFVAQGFSCSISSIKRFVGRDCLFARAAILNLGHIEQAQLCHLHVRVTSIKCPSLWGMTLI